MIDMKQFKKLSDKIDGEAASLMATPYAYERNLSEDDKSKAPQTLREAKEAILRMTPLLGDMLRLINSELGPDDDDGDDGVSEIRTLVDAKAVLSNAVSEFSVKKALDTEDYHDSFPEDYVDGDVDMADEAETYRWGFNSLYNAVLRVLHAVEVYGLWSNNMTEHKISELRKACIDTIQIIENSDKAGVNIEWENKEKIKKNLREVLDNTL